MENQELIGKHIFTSFDPNFRTKNVEGQIVALQYDKESDNWIFLIRMITGNQGALWVRNHTQVSFIEGGYGTEEIKS